MPMQPSRSFDQPDGFRWLTQTADMASFVALREFIMGAAKAARSTFSTSRETLAQSVPLLEASMTECASLSE